VPGSIKPLAHFSSIILCLKGQDEPEYKEYDITKTDQVLMTGMVVFVYASYFFGNGKVYFSEPIKNPTVMDLQESIDSGLALSKDTKHIYLEMLQEIDNKLDFFDMIEIPFDEKRFKDCRIISLETGS